MVYERLNLITVCVSILTAFYFNNQYFYSYNPWLKKYFMNLIRKLGLKQINHVHFLDSGIQAKEEEISRNIGDKVMAEYPQIFAPLIKYMNDGRAKDILKQIFVLGERDISYKYLILKEFVLRNSKEIIYYFPTNKRLIHRLETITPPVSIIKWHCFFITLLDIARSIFFSISLFTVPFILLTKMLLEKKVAFRKEKEEIIRKAIFFHASVGLDLTNFTRNMYFFRKDILNISECIHSGLFLPLTANKTKYLRKKEGIVCEHRNHKTQLTLFIKRFILDYYKDLFPVFFVFSYNKFMTYSVLRGFISAIFDAVRIESFMENINVKLAYFEVEYSVFPGIFTIIANRHNVKTMTMIHGFGAYVIPQSLRSNTVINYCLVPGKYYNKYLLPNNPHTDYFCPVGNHEIDNTSFKKRYDYIQFKKDGRKIVGVFAALYWPFFPEILRKRNLSIFNEVDAKAIFFKYWQPFFEWAVKQDNIFLIFKGKTGAKQFAHPFVQEIMSILNDKHILQDDDIPISEIINESDCTLCSSDSAMFYNSLTLGVPSVGYDWTGNVGATKYNKHLVAKTPEELIANLTYVLKHGLPESVYEEVRRDHYADGIVDNMTDIRIKSLITDVISENDFS